MAGVTILLDGTIANLNVDGFLVDMVWESIPLPVF